MSAVKRPRANTAGTGLPPYSTEGLTDLLKVLKPETHRRLLFEAAIRHTDVMAPITADDISNTKVLGRDRFKATVKATTARTPYKTKFTVYEDICASFPYVGSMIDWYGDPNLESTLVGGRGDDLLSVLKTFTTEELRELVKTRPGETMEDDFCFPPDEGATWLDHVKMIHEICGGYKEFKCDEVLEILQTAVAEARYWEDSLFEQQDTRSGADGLIRGSITDGRLGVDRWALGAWCELGPEINLSQSVS